MARDRNRREAAVKSFIDTGRRWRCLNGWIGEYREKTTGEAHYYLTLDDKPMDGCPTLRGAKIAARHHGARGEWIEDELPKTSAVK